MDLQAFADRVCEIVWGGERAWTEPDGLKKLARQVLVIKQAAQQPFAPDALRVCGKCGLSEQNHADHLCNPNYSAGKA